MSIQKYHNFINESSINTFIPHKLRGIGGKYDPIKKIHDDDDFLEKINKLVLNKCVIFQSYNYSEHSSDSFELIVRVVDFNAFGRLIFRGILVRGIWEKTDGEGYVSFAVKEDKKVEVLDTDIDKILDDVKNRKELNRIKHFDVDPYGEEEWED